MPKLSRLASPNNLVPHRAPIVTCISWHSITTGHLNMVSLTISVLQPLDAVVFERVLHSHSITKKIAYIISNQDFSCDNVFY